MTVNSILLFVLLRENVTCSLAKSTDFLVRIEAEAISRVCIGASGKILFEFPGGGSQDTDRTLPQYCNFSCIAPNILCGILSRGEQTLFIYTLALAPRLETSPPSFQPAMLLPLPFPSATFPRAEAISSQEAKIRSRTGPPAFFVGTTVNRRVVIDRLGWVVRVSDGLVVEEV